MEEGRRTRSTRSKAAPIEMPVATRTTRRTKKQNIDVDEEEQLEHSDEQMQHEPVTETNTDVQMETIDLDTGDGDNQFELPQTNEDNGSSNFGFDDNLTFEQQSNEKEETHVEQEAFIADLAEENANSFPSACDDNSVEKSMVMKSDFITNQNESAAAQDSVDNDYQMVDEQSLDKTEDTFAQSEDLKVADQQATDLDAENISEDELPMPLKPKVQDAEEVSDEELPGPKMAELPADTEVVSEEELPATNVKKDGKRKLDDYDPSEPTDESDAPEKKIKKDDEAAEKKYRLPELEKYWKPVKADSDDFNAWTYLLQYVDSESDVEAARDVYDSFLSRYCYCYGYWRKYADYEKKKGSLEKCDEVFERGLKAIPLSIDLWIHYLTHIKQKYQNNRDMIRSQFERALDACGLEFRSDKLWEGFIRWEMEDKNFQNVTAIYDRLLATPTQGYKTHMENFREFVNNNPVQKLIQVEEFKKYREEVRKDSSEKTDDEIPPGEDEEDDHVRSEEEADAIRKMIISKRKKINKANVEMINKRWTFEEGIKRPYFHVKQLEKIQLKNWKEYLDFEIEQGNRKRILILFERCLIACALYEEFWIKLIRYLEDASSDPEFEARSRDVYERACLIHHQDKLSLHLMWSTFEESCGNVDKASSILENLDKKHPNLLQIAYKRINLERRRGNFKKCIALYEQYAANTTKNKNIFSSLAIKYARFQNKIMHSYDKAVEILKSALEKDPTNTRIALQIIDLALQREKVDEKEVLEVLDKFVNQDNLDCEQKLLFAQRKVEFLEDFGSSVKELHEAQKVLQVALEKSKENKKKTTEHTGESAPSKKPKDSGTSNNGATYSGSAYNYPGYNSGYPPNQWQGNSYDYNQWSGSYYNQSSYGNYGNSY